MLLIQQIKIEPGSGFEHLKREVARQLRISDDQIQEMTIKKKSIDARKKPNIYEVYSVVVKADKKTEAAILKKHNTNVQLYEEHSFSFQVKGTKEMEHAPVIVGMGPAGLFCAYYLALNGYCPIVFERGEDVDKRTESVIDFWNGKPLNTDSNVQFGEGGAGTFSDGKLNTMVKDKEGIGQAILQIFCKMGANESILYDSKPHIGTDILKNVVKKMRQEILKNGGKIYFQTRLQSIHYNNKCIESIEVIDLTDHSTKVFYCEQLILALGHSARDTIHMLYDKGIQMQAKSFAIGMRVMHSQELINEAQYGVNYKKKYKMLPNVSYKLTAQTSGGRGVYSFCMCPGGYVVNASSEEGRLAVNGMSYSSRQGMHANSAIVMTISETDYGNATPLDGMHYQEKLEKTAYEIGEGKIPIQFYGDFKNREDSEYRKIKEDEYLPSISAKGACKFADLHALFEPNLSEAFIEGMENFQSKIHGFASDDVLLLGLESRTSSPVRMNRDEHYQSNIQGIYPCGEGAGYAGGIVSAAMDGVKVAQCVALNYAPIVK